MSEQSLFCSLDEVWVEEEIQRVILWSEASSGDILGHCIFLRLWSHEAMFSTACSLLGHINPLKGWFDLLTKYREKAK